MVMREAAGVPMLVVKNDNPPGDAFLRTPSLPVRPDDPALTRLLARMQASVEELQGVGIAAPQIGVNRRVILVRRLDMEPEKPFQAFLNPVIEEFSAERLLDWEGCLSVPAGFGQVRRAERIRLRYTRPDGSEGSEEIGGFTARIFQHEIDHLDGILFIDRKEPGELIPEKEYREMRRRQREGVKQP
jgi:peptide deformylase